MELTCLECGQPFGVSAAEQELFDRKKFREMPKRCRACRDQRKTRLHERLRADAVAGGKPA